MTQIDKLISLNGTRSKEEWCALRQHMVDSLSDYLQQPVEIVDSSIEESIVDDEALCCVIRSLPTDSPLALTWEGRLGLDIIEHGALAPCYLGRSQRRGHNVIKFSFLSIPTSQAKSRPPPLP